MEHFFEYALPVALFIVTAYVIKEMLEAKTRHRLIEKGMVDEKVKHLFQSQPPRDTRLSSLKWGMILVGVGIAFLVGQFLPEEISEGVTVSSAVILAGLALLIFYGVKSRVASNDRDRHPQA